MATKDITVDGNLTNVTSLSSSDRLLIIENASATLKDTTWGVVLSEIQADIPASTSASGVMEVATTAETNTGTDATRAVSPDGLAGSYAGTASVSGLVQSGTVSTGDGKVYILMPAKVNGMNLIGCSITVITKSTSGTPTVQLARGRQANATTAHAFTDMLTTKMTIDANEFSSLNAATAAVIDTSADDILSGDLIRVDIDVAGTGTADMYVYLEFQLP